MPVGLINFFAFSEWILKHGSFTLWIIIVYPPPYSTNHPVTIRTFVTESSTYLESIVMSSEPLLITEDFNIHVDELGQIKMEILSLSYLNLRVSYDMWINQHISQDTPFISKLRNWHYQHKPYPTQKLKILISANSMWWGCSNNNIKQARKERRNAEKMLLSFWNLKLI